MLRHVYPCFTRHRIIGTATHVCRFLFSCIRQPVDTALACKTLKGKCLPNTALALKTPKGTVACPTVCAEPLSQLEAEVKKQADLIVNLQSAALANSKAHNELVQHFQHLRAHVRRNTKSHKLLQDLSGAVTVNNSHKYASQC